MNATLGELTSLKGRRAIITGGGGHIGRSINRALIEWGAETLLLDYNQEALDSACAESNGQSCSHVINLEESKDIENLSKDYGKQSVDIIVHAAALVGTSDLQGWAVPFEKQNIDTFRRALEVNLTSFFTLCQAFAPRLRESKNGSIIAIGSIYGVVAPDLSLYQGTTLGNPAGYAASKGGLIQLVKWMSTILAPEIRVNAVSPGGIWRNQDKTFVERYENKTPMKRMGKEEDIIGSVAYLASDLSGYMTGQNLIVDGGWTAW